MSATSPQVADPGADEASHDDGLEPLAGRTGPVTIAAAVAEEYLGLVRAEAQAATASRASARAQTPASAQTDAKGGVAIIPLQGVITPRGSMLARIFGLGSGGLQCFRDSFRAALADDNVTSILLDIDSPGGLIDLVPETAAEIRAARGTKPIVAFANTHAASAAYWLAAQADEIVVTPSGQVGSIGVVMIHEDISRMEEMMGIKTTIISAGRYKADGNFTEPLSKSAMQAMQGKVNDLYDLFVSDVAAGRKADPAAIAAGYGQGGMVLATEAQQLGMVDRVETFEQTLARLGGMADEDDELDGSPADDDGETGEDEPEARTGSDKPAANRLYGEDRRERPAWHL